MDQQNTPYTHQQVRALPLGFNETAVGPNNAERRAIRKEMNNRNRQVQIVNGKRISHAKKFHGPQYWNIVEDWRHRNKAKRQKAVIAEAA